MSENERLADQLYIEIMRAFVQYLGNHYTTEQLIQRIRMIVRAANL